MAYLVLARKWRPQTFDDLIGQEAITRTLKNAITLGRVHHALLFTGTRGVGKTTAARIIAKALNCEQGPTATPCGTCSNCKEITAGANVDVLEIDGASNTSVDDVRDLRETIRYAASKSKHKIYIIDEVHMLSNSAFNALLKTLEEPPAGVFFIFATTEVHKIPDTILSRVQRFDFREISEDTIAGHLTRIATAEKIQIAEESLRIVARQAEGSMRDALSLFDQIIAFAATEDLKINDAEVVQVLGLTDRALIAQTLESFTAYSSPQALDVLGRVVEMGFDLKSYLLDLLDLVRQALFLKAGAAGKELPPYAQGLKAIDAIELERWFELVKRAVEDLSRAVLPKHSIELAFLKITRAPVTMPLQTLVERLEKLEKRLASGQKLSPEVSNPPPVSFNPPGESTPPKPNSTPTSTPISTPQTKAFSQAEFLEEIKRKKPAMFAVVEQCREFKLEQSTLTLLFDEGSFYLTRARDQNFVQTLAGILKDLTGQTLKVDIASVAPSMFKPTSSLESMKEREKEALSHPVVKKAVSLFQARIEDIKPLE